MIVDMVTVDITKAAMNNAPTYTAATQVKKKAKKTPSAASDRRKEITTAFIVATRKKNMNTRHPVNAREVIVPTCTSCIESKTGKLRS